MTHSVIGGDVTLLLRRINCREALAVVSEHVYHTLRCIPGDHTSQHIVVIRREWFGLLLPEHWYRAIPGGLAMITAICLLTLALVTRTLLHHCHIYEMLRLRRQWSRLADALPSSLPYHKYAHYEAPYYVMATLSTLMRQTAARHVYDAHYT